MAEDLKKEVKALLFSSGKPLDPEYIGQLVKASKADVEKVIEELTQDLDSVKDPMIIVKDGLGYKMTVRERYLDLVRHIVPETELSKTVMETLAVVVWKQPVLQSEIIRIRTNKAYDHMDQLEASGFITKTKHGRTYLIRGTQKLYDYFDVPNAEAMKHFFEGFKDVDPEKRKLKQLGNLAVYEVPKQEHPKAPLVPVPVDKDHIGVLEVYEGSQEKAEPSEAEKEVSAEVGGRSGPAEEELEAPVDVQDSELFASEEIDKEAEKRAAELLGARPEKYAEEDEPESTETHDEAPEGFEPAGSSGEEGQESGDKGVGKDKKAKRSKKDDDRELNPKLESMIDDVAPEEKDDDEIDLS
ncbi:SMC-Scp complex subunit ScpB [Candidatus Woesearchaeota archaeon]|nr:SMC-Scp complex subunit ScpB [Candidatus Woesearchaeota archaeon]